MWDKVKEFAGWIVAVVVGAFGVLLYLLKRKDEQLDSAKAQNELHEADKESAIIDTEIKNLEEDKKSTDKDIDKANTELVDLQEERDQAIDREKNRKPDEVEDYWNK